MATNDPLEATPTPTQPAEVEARSDVGSVDIVKSICTCVDCRGEGKPYAEVMHCPSCGLQHVDQLDKQTGIDWATKPHKKHKCVDWTEVNEERNAADEVVSSTSILHRGCGFEWQPSLVHTVGVIKYD